MLLAGTFATEPIPPMAWVTSAGRPRETPGGPWYATGEADTRPNRSERLTA